MGDDQQGARPAVEVILDLTVEVSMSRSFVGSSSNKTLGSSSSNRRI